MGSATKNALFDRLNLILSARIPLYTRDSKAKAREEVKIIPEHVLMETF